MADNKTDTQRITIDLDVQAYEIMFKNASDLGLGIGEYIKYTCIPEVLNKYILDNLNELDRMQINSEMDKLEFDYLHARLFIQLKSYIGRRAKVELYMAKLIEIKNRVHKQDNAKEK